MANSIAHRLLESERFTDADINHTLNVKRSYTAILNAARVDGHLLISFSDMELCNAIKDLKTRKRMDLIIPQVNSLKSEPKCRFWPRDSCFTCLSHL